jgi:hypothetical protein
MEETERSDGFAGEYKSLFFWRRRRPPRSTARGSSDVASHSLFRGFCRD